MGKGRQIAALTKEFMATGGKRVLWISTSSDLRYDARRDLNDMDCPDIKIFPQVNSVHSCASILSGAQWHDSWPLRRLHWRAAHQYLELRPVKAEHVRLASA